MLKVVRAPNSVLRDETTAVKKIAPKYKQIISEMVLTAKSFQDPEGVGLAATQVGISEQFFIAKLEPDKLNPDFPANAFTPIFNPRITWRSKRTKVTLEGCLSIPDYYGEVSRPSMVKVSFTDINGREVKTILKGTNATIYQHEYDHLHGKLFIDYVLEQKMRLFKVKGKDKAGADIFEEVTLDLFSPKSS